MVKETVFRSIIEFFEDIGVYDVILPFILVFTMVFAILEKTKILGVDTFDGKEYTKKNLNAMIAFVIAFIVVASTRLVSAINEAVGNIVILLLLSICFLLLIGSFYRQGEDVFLEGPWRKFFMIIMFIAIVIIFLHAIPTKSGESWLEWFWEYLEDHWMTGKLAGSVILVIVVILFMIYIINPKERSAVSSKK